MACGGDGAPVCVWGGGGDPRVGVELATMTSLPITFMFKFRKDVSFSEVFALLLCWIFIGNMFFKFKVKFSCKVMG